VTLQNGDHAFAVSSDFDAGRLVVIAQCHCWKNIICTKIGNECVCLKYLRKFPSTCVVAWWSLTKVIQDCVTAVNLLNDDIPWLTSVIRRLLSKKSTAVVESFLIARDVGVRPIASLNAKV
jgi:hypothetical protein